MRIYQYLDEAGMWRAMRDAKSILDISSANSCSIELIMAE